MDMYYSRQVRDLNVHLSEDPKVEGKVKDIVMDLQNAKVKGFWLDKLGLWKNSQFLPLKDIVLMDQKNIIIKNAKNLQKTKDINENELISSWYGTPVYNDEGGDWGTLSDILWSYPDGNILGFAVSQGILKDMKRGWYFLPRNAVDIKDTNREGIILNNDFQYLNEVIRLNSKE